jgi:hypothetical protein
MDFINNFSKFYEDFKKDTNLDAKENMELYIQYYNGRMNDMTYQTQYTMLNQLLHKVDILPDRISLSISQMFNENYKVKEIIQALKNKP